MMKRANQIKGTKGGGRYLTDEEANFYKERFKTIGITTMNLGRLIFKDICNPRQLDKILRKEALAYPNEIEQLNYYANLKTYEEYMEEKNNE